MLLLKSRFNLCACLQIELQAKTPPALRTAMSSRPTKTPHSGLWGVTLAIKQESLGLSRNSSSSARHSNFNPILLRHRLYLMRQLIQVAFGLFYAVRQLLYLSSRLVHPVRQGMHFPLRRVCQLVHRLARL